MKGCALILAGGEGKRMRSNRPKVLAEVLFKPLLRWVIDAVREAGIDDICVVTGSRREAVEQYISGLPFPVRTAYQPERLGTGHAVMMASEFLKDHSGERVLILNGDAPFISPGTLKDALAAGQDCDAMVITARVDDPTGYGRIIRDENGSSLKAIIEEKEADDEIRKIREINSGAYCFSVDSLLSALAKLTRSEKTGEYYLTDTIGIIKNSSGTVQAFEAENADSVLGANDCCQLEQLCRIAARRMHEKHWQNGVVIPCTDGVLISAEAVIGANTVILPATVIKGSTVIGESCELGPGIVLEDCTIADNTIVRQGIYGTDQ